MAENAVIYARYSTGKNQTDQSIDGQLRVCQEYAERHDLCIVGEYIDRAITGRSDDRPEFQRMVVDSKKNEFNFVIVYMLDRFARNRYDSAIYKRELKKHGVRVLSAMEQISDEPEGIILEALLEAEAELYSRRLSRRVSNGRKQGALNGKFIGVGLPFGYKSENGQVVFDPVKAETMKWAFNEYAKGTTKKDIIAEINARGFQNQKGQPFNNTSFAASFKSRVYLGELRQCGVVSPCPALIDVDTFNKVQRRIAQNKREGGKKKAKMEYLLSGKLYCGHCGGAMRGMSGTSKTGEKFYYYSCINKRLKKCDKKHEKKDFLEWYVVEQTMMYVLDSQRIKEIAKRVVARYDSEFSDRQIKSLEKLVEKLDRELRNCVDAIATIPEAGRPALYNKIESIGTQKSDVEYDLSKLRIANGIRLTESEVVTFLKSFCNGDPLDMTFRRRIVDAFINSIYLFDDRVVIYYNIKDGKQISYIDMLEETAGGGEELPEFSAKGVRILSDEVHHI